MADGSHITPSQNFLISPSAAKRIAALMQAEAENSFLRVSVSGGGCSGFQYGFDIESGATQAEDRVFKREGATVVVDETSLDLLGGAEIDFVEDLSGSFFQVRNPNAASSCGCGMSFSVG